MPRRRKLLFVWPASEWIDLSSIFAVKILPLLLPTHFLLFILSCCRSSFSSASCSLYRLHTTTCFFSASRLVLKLLLTVAISYFSARASYTSDHRLPFYLSPYPRTQLFWNQEKLVSATCTKSRFYQDIYHQLQNTPCCECLLLSDTPRFNSHLILLHVITENRNFHVIVLQCHAPT